MASLTKHIQVAALAMIGFLPASMASAAVLNNLNPGDSVKSIISAFQNAMAGLIAQAGTETRVSMVRAFQLSDALIHSLSAAYADNLNITFDQLDDQQKKAFTDTRRLLLDIEQAVAKPTAQMTNTVDRFTAVLADLGSWTKKPMITAYFPSYIGPTSLVQDVMVTATGFRLQDAEYGNPKLFIGNKEFPSSQLTDVSVGFVIPRTAFKSAKSGTAIESATVKLFRKPDKMFGGTREIEFQLMFTVLPETLGSFAVSTVERVERTDIMDYASAPPLTATIYGGGIVPSSQCYHPPSGYKFEVGTASAVETARTGLKHKNTSPSINIGTVSLDPEHAATPERICIKVTAATGCKECAGSTSGRLEAKVVKRYYDDVRRESGHKPLGWNSDERIPIPNNANVESITVKLFGDVTKMGSPTSPPNIPFVSFDYDPRSQSIFLRPKQAWVALDE